MPALIERPKMTKTMYQALKHHIMRERDRKKQEQEQDALLERQRKERQMKKKKEEEDNLTFGQTKEQIQQLEEKLKAVTQEKHELFSQLKKLLHHEEESRRRAGMKEQGELMSLQQAYPTHTMPVILQQGQITHQQPVFRQQSMMPAATVKRPRSPSPSQSQPTIYPQYRDSKIIASPLSVAKQHSVALYTHQCQGDYKSGGIFTQSEPTQLSYMTQPGHSYQKTQVVTGYTPSKSSASKYKPSSQKSTTSYQSHFTQQQLKQKTEPYPRYSVQCVQQPGYMGLPHTSSIPLQQKLEHENQKAGFNEDKYKMQQQQQLRGVATHPIQQPSLVAQSIQIQQQPKGGIITGYSAMGQALPQAINYKQPPVSQTNYPTQQGTPGRTSYTGQHPGQYF